jgi:pyruvate-formate lyase-activating enzyme
MKEILTKVNRTFNALKHPGSPTLALMEGPVNCNRSCSYCIVPKRWDADKTSTLEQTYEQIDWLYSQGFSILNYVGGETFAKCPQVGDVISETRFICPHTGQVYLIHNERATSAPFRTKEGITFEEHTLEVIKYANKKGMLTVVTTNGDFTNYFSIAKFKKAGLDVLTFSLHSVNEKSLEHIISCARMAAKEGIIPIVSVVFTEDRADIVNKVARTCAANGILFSTAIVQERGGGFSAIPEESKIPIPELQRKVFDELLILKKKGFVRTNKNYLQNATNFPNNSWKCNPETNAFVHIRALEKGKLGVCSEKSTSIQIEDTNLRDEKWKKTKRDLVEKCEGCLYACHYESENPSLKGDIPTLVNMGLIKLGQSELVKKMGKKAVNKDPNDINPIPLSEDEKFQIKYKKDQGLFGKTKRFALSTINAAGNIALLSTLIGYGLIKGRSPNKSIDLYMKYIVLHGGL